MSQFSFGIVIGIRDIDRRTQNNMRIQICDPEANPIHDTGLIEIPIIDGAQNDAIPCEGQGFYIALDLRNVGISALGAYITTIELNDVVLGEYPIYFGLKSSIAQQSKISEI